MMRCIAIQEFGNDLDLLALQERPDPVATGYLVRVKVLATALNRADLLQRRGLYPAPADSPADIPGLEFVGIVEQVGELVQQWKGGERVMGLLGGGGYATKVLTHESLLVAVPENLNDVQAAAVPEVFITAHDALVTQGRLRPGDNVLVQAAAGGVGSAAIQLAEVFGAQVAGTSRSQDKLDAIAHLGACTPVLHDEAGFREAVQALWGKQGVDLVLDVLGGQPFVDSLKLLRKRGRIVSVGVMAGLKAEVPLGLVLGNRLQITGTVLRSRSLAEKIAATRLFAREVVPFLASGRLQPVVDQVFAFEDYRAATTRMEENRNVGKIILQVTA